MIEQIKEHIYAVVDEGPTAEEVPTAEEITAVEKSSDEKTTTEECTAEVPMKEESIAIDESEACASNESPEEETNSETETTEVSKSIVEPKSTSAGLDPSSISDLLAKNEQGQLSQQGFFRIFLISVHEDGPLELQSQSSSLIAQTNTLQSDHSKLESKLTRTTQSEKEIKKNLNQLLMDQKGLQSLHNFKKMPYDMFFIQKK